MSDRFDERLLRYLEGTASEPEIESVERELAASSSLRSELEEARRGLAAIRDLAAAPGGPAPPLADRTLERVGSGPRRGAGSTPGTSRPGNVWRRVATIAALILLPASGWFARGWLAPPRPAGGPPIPGAVTTPPVINPQMEEYLLLFTGSWSDLEGLEPQEQMAREQAYMSWLGWLEENDRFVAGAELGAGPGILFTSAGMGISEFEPDLGPDEVIVGFVYVRAESLEEAREIARTCPHVEYGSGVLLKRAGGL